ncbi:MAG: hypothetical protein AAFO29_14370 [Actinomycetota bacterium]
MSVNDTLTMSLDDERPDPAPTPSPRPRRQRVFGLIIAGLMIASLVLAYANRNTSGADDAAASIQAGSTDEPEDDTDGASDEEPDGGEEQEDTELLSDGGPSTSSEPGPNDVDEADDPDDEGSQATFTTRTTERTPTTATTGSSSTARVTTTRPSTSGPTTTVRTTTTTRGSTASSTTARPSTTVRPTTTAAPTTARPTTTTTRPTTTTTRPTTTTTQPPPPVALSNGGFDRSNVAAGAFQILSSIPGWTSSTGEFEIWGTGHNSVNAAAGSHLLELNANGPATLHQDFATTPGTTIRWQFSHRGRDGAETVELMIGAPGGRLTSVQTAATGRSWKRYQGTYTVPAGQTVTRLAIASRTPGRSGNLVDEFSVTLVD